MLTSKFSKTTQRLPLVFCLFIFLGVPGSISPVRGVSPWSIPPERWDLLLVRNYPPYLVEGKAGLGVVLGETEQRLLKMWGAPNSRDYGRPESLFYKSEIFVGRFILKAGRIAQIRYHITEETPGSLTWLTALGLRGEDLKKIKTTEDICKKILAFYGNVIYTKLPKELILHNRGIHFLFREKGIREIRIFKPNWGGAF